MRARALLLAGLVLAAGCGTDSSDRVIVAAGTTLTDSGFLDELASRFETTASGAELSIIGESTQQVLELGRRGGGDLLITHHPAAEEAFVSENAVAAYRPVFSSSFVLVGPPDQIQEVAGLDAGAALSRIASERWAFVSRGDGSGTHAAELALWEASGIDPTGMPWHTETGQGMGLTLQVADQRSAWTIAEEGAFVASEPSLSLQPAVLDGTIANPYHAIVMTGEVSASAAAFVDWLTSAEGQSEVEDVNEHLFGRSVYLPAG